MSPIHTISRIVVVDQGHLCVSVNPKNPSYAYLPGGHIEEEESAEESVRREIFEEMGDTLHTLRFLGTVEHIFHRPQSCHSHEINLIFQASLTRWRYPDIPVSLEPTSVEFRWINLNDVHLPLLPHALTNLIPQWIQDPLSAPFYSVIHGR